MKTRIVFARRGSRDLPRDNVCSMKGADHDPPLRITSYNHPIADMTPEPKRPLKVFLCHAHADRDPVRGLYSRLTQVSNGLCRGLADKSGLINPCMYYLPHTSQSPFKSVNPL
jgi:hypothetical protein